MLRDRLSIVMRFVSYLFGSVNILSALHLCSDYVIPEWTEYNLE